MSRCARTTAARSFLFRRSVPLTNPPPFFSPLSPLTPIFPPLSPLPFPSLAVPSPLSLQTRQRLTNHLSHFHARCAHFSPCLSCTVEFQLNGRTSSLVSAGSSSFLQFLPFPLFFLFLKKFFFFVPLPALVRGQARMKWKHTRPCICVELRLMQLQSSPGRRRTKEQVQV